MPLLPPLKDSLPPLEGPAPSAGMGNCHQLAGLKKARWTPCLSTCMIEQAVRGKRPGLKASHGDAAFRGLKAPAPSVERLSPSVGRPRSLSWNGKLSSASGLEKGPLDPMPAHLHD